MTDFAVWAPRPQRVQVDVDGVRYAMDRDGGDWWRAEVPAAADSRYGFVLDDDDTVLPDPRSARQPVWSLPSIRNAIGPTRRRSSSFLPSSPSSGFSGSEKSAVAFCSGSFSHSLLPFGITSTRSSVIAKVPR